MTEPPVDRTIVDGVRGLVEAYTREIHQLGHTTPDAHQLDMYARRAFEILMECVGGVRRLSELELTFMRSLDRTLIGWDVTAPDLVRLHGLAPAAAQRVALAQRVDAATPQRSSISVRQVGAVFLAITSQVRADVFADRLPAARLADPEAAAATPLARLLSGQANVETERDALREAGFVAATSYLVVGVDCISTRNEAEHSREIARKAAQLLDAQLPGGRFRALTGVVGGRPTALLPTDERILEPVRATAKDVVAQLTTWDAIGAAAVGGPAPSLELLPVTHRRVIRTLDVMHELQLGIDVMTTHEALPYLLLRRDPELLADLASVLDRLDSDPGDVSVLLDTVRAVAEHSGNVVATGRDLGVHRHTVYARMKRIEELTGLQPEDAQDRLVLEFAAKARELLGRNAVA